MDVNVYNKLGKDAGTMSLPDEMFNVEVSEALVHEAVVNQQANAREVLAHAKDRSEVRGGGRKPWRQKGTGRARHGSRNSPIWSGGGVTFGPMKSRNFSIKMNRKARRKALFMVLSDKLANDAIVIVDDLSMPEGKTKDLKVTISALPLKGKKSMFVVDPSNMTVRRAAKNLEFVSTIAPNSINVIDALKANTIVVGKTELESMVSHFTK
jgi:large subunit ribosomal protein L4